MAPTTRAAGKRKREEKVDTSTLTKKTKHTVKTSTDSAKSEQPASKALQHFRFLDLSPELRNKVYDYAKEDDSSRFAPQPLWQFHLLRRKSHAERTWRFFGLTQACAQIRAEYRPMWIQDLRVGFMGTHQITSFVKTFLHHATGPNHAPKLLQITWEHGCTNQDRCDLMSMLLLHAQCPSSQFQFVPYNVANGETVQDDICYRCMREYHMEERGIDSDSDFGACECPDYDMDHEEWMEFKDKQMEYTSDIPVFVHNANEAWLKAVQEAKITASCSFCPMGDHVVFKVLYKDPVCETTADSQPAWDLMKQWGIFDLPTKRGTDFIFAYEGKQTTEKDGYSMAHSVTRQIVFRKTPSKT